MQGMRLIDANALKKKVDYFDCHECGDDCNIEFVTLDNVDNAPTIDAVPVVHGRWSDEDTERYVCTVCGKWFFIDSGDGDMNYCPNCGAKMDGGAEWTSLV